MSELFVSYLGPCEENARDMMLLDRKEYISCGLPHKQVNQLVKLGDIDQINSKIMTLENADNHIGVYGIVNRDEKPDKKVPKASLIGYMESNSWDKCNQKPMIKMFGKIALKYMIFKNEKNPYVINSLVVDSENTKNQSEAVNIFFEHAIENITPDKVIYSVLNQDSPTADILTTSYGFQDTGYSGKIDGVNKTLYKRPPYINVMVRVASFSFMQSQCSVEV